jgi:hypothetical protein
MVHKSHLASRSVEDSIEIKCRGYVTGKEMKNTEIKCRGDVIG